MRITVFAVLALAGLVDAAWGCTACGRHPLLGKSKRVPSGSMVCKPPPRPTWVYLEARAEAVSDTEVLVRVTNRGLSYSHATTVHLVLTGPDGEREVLSRYVSGLHPGKSWSSTFTPQRVPAAGPGTTVTASCSPYPYWTRPVRKPGSPSPTSGAKPSGEAEAVAAAVCKAPTLP
jgi:hypothetical protein